MRKGAGHFVDCGSVEKLFPKIAYSLPESDKKITVVPEE